MSFSSSLLKFIDCILLKSFNILTLVTSSSVRILYRRGEHFGVQQVCTDVLDRWDFQEACSRKDFSHAAVTDCQCGCVGKVQQCSQCLCCHKVDVVYVLLVRSNPWSEELVEVGAAWRQDRAVSRELAILGNQENVTQQAAHPLLVQAAQDVCAVLRERDSHGAFLCLPCPSSPSSTSTACRPPEPPSTSPTGSWRHLPPACRRAA